MGTRRALVFDRATRTLVGLILFVAVGAACRAGSTDPAFGEAVSVRMGAAVNVPGDTTSVRFSDVTADSRCPQGAQCVWAGDAAVLFTVAGAQLVTLHTSGSVGAASAIVSGRLMTLVSLAPTPKVGQAITKGDYVATIRFDAARD